LKDWADVVGCFSFWVGWKKGVKKGDRVMTLSEEERARRGGRLKERQRHTQREGHGVRLAPIQP
jgi:hypothetical protein